MDGLQWGGKDVLRSSVSVQPVSGESGPLVRVSGGGAAQRERPRSDHARAGTMAKERTGVDCELFHVIPNIDNRDRTRHRRGVQQAPQGRAWTGSKASLAWKPTSGHKCTLLQ